MADRTKPHVETMLQHLGEEEQILGAVVPPIFQTSLFVFDTWEQFAEAQDHQFDLTYEDGRCYYSRVNNPTLDLVGKKVAALEKTECARMFTSGASAISTAVMASTRTGSHVVCVDTCYGPTRRYLADYMPRFGVETTFVVGTDPEEVFEAIRPETSLIFLESPGSIIYRLQDLATIAQEAKRRGIRTAVDNSYCSPIFQTPAEFGIDIVLHSATKYLGGHSDVVAGALCTSNEIMLEIMANEVEFIGASLPPFPSWLILRSLRTLPIRMDQHAKSADAVARWLRDRPEVKQVFHTGFEDSPQRELFLKQMHSSAGLISFEPVDQDRDRLRAFIEALRLYQLGVSWGGHESLCVPLEYQPLDWPEKKWLVRLFCGLEHADDLIADLDQAFAVGQPRS
ncbi:MAG: aminotransferase class I/II-fold pyridoxal phosphate-dependent enzyme [Armatimonadetes bacterium]|nr:aminotransferase class I/II-fold pyridoxal phosphate-dependent enzyme [Armatimonadota bacterium]